MPDREEIISAWRKSFGDQLRFVREQHELSQERLASLAGLDRKLVYRTELGQTSPRVDAVVAIAMALGVPVRELMPDQ